jgi:molybdopterin-containing oxidoreductase family membrane subunit
METNKLSEKITGDLLRTVGITKGFIVWMTFLLITFGACLYAYSIQLRTGLGVTGLGDYISWGMYISNFVFFVASSLIGMLISAVLGLAGVKWITPLTRIAEIIALAFAAVAGLVIVSDMGRPDRLQYVFMHGRLQSPILWDITVVTTYVVISALLLYLPMISDIALCEQRLVNAPKWQRITYRILALNWKGNDRQVAIITKSVKILLVLIVPVALAIHTVTSWLFAATTRTGWNSSIFGPYFVTGAFVAGAATVIIAMYFFRANYKLQEYITDEHFDKMGKLLVLVALVYLYFNINEFLVPAYKMEKAEARHLYELFAGKYAFMFWMAQLFGLILPIILLLFKQMRRPFPMFLIGLSVFIASWFKRYLIVVPTIEHPFLPIQNVPEHFKFYTPTIIESAITLASFILVLMIISVLSKLFPVIPVEETIHEQTNKH